MADRVEFHPEDTHSDAEINEKVREACDIMESIYEGGEYPEVVVKRSWAKHKPIITGEIGHRQAVRWYLLRELKKLAERGALIKIFPTRERLELNDPALLDNTDEDDWDITKKTLFLFSPERIEISLTRLSHYTGTAPQDFQRYILFTNYDMHMEVFRDKFPNCKEPTR